MTENICCVCGREYELKNGGWYCPRCMAKRFSADERLTVRVTDEPTETVEESVTEAKPTDKDKVEPVKIIEDIFVENELRVAERNLKAGNFETARKYYEIILEKGENASALRGLIYTLLETKGEDSHAAALNIHKLRSLELVSRLIQIDEENVLDVAWLIGVVGKSLEMRVNPEGMNCSYIKSTEELSDDTVERSTTPGGTAKSALALAIKLMNLVDEKKHYLLADSLFKVAHNAKLLGCFDEAQAIFEHLCTLCESSWELRIAELEARRRARNTDELIRTKGDIGTDSALMRAMELVPRSNDTSIDFLARLSVEQSVALKVAKAERVDSVKDRAVWSLRFLPLLPPVLFFLLALFIPSAGWTLFGVAMGLLPIGIYLFLYFFELEGAYIPVLLSTGSAALVTSLLLLCFGNCSGAGYAALFGTLGLFVALTFFNYEVEPTVNAKFLWSLFITAGFVLYGVAIGIDIGFDSVWGGLFAGILIALGVVFNTVCCILFLEDAESCWVHIVAGLFYGLGAIALFVLCFVSRALAFMAMPSIVTLFVSFILWACFTDRMTECSDGWMISNILSSIATSVFVILTLCWSFGVWRSSPVNADNEGYRVNMTYSEEVIVIPEGVTHLERVRAPRAEKIVLPSTLVYIGDGCFRGCGAVEIDIPETVTYIGDKAFKKCKSLTDVDLPDSLTYLGKSAFKKCESIVSIEIPAGITELKDYTFQYCLGLKEVMFNEGLETIGLSCFNNCVSLTDVYLPDSLTNMVYCFNYCSNLRSISLGKGLIRLNATLFDYSNIPLLAVTFRGTEEEWNNIPKDEKWYKSAEEIELTFTEQ